MNIIFTCHTYYPNHDGVQFVTQYLAEGLAKKGHNVTILTNCNEKRENNKIEFHNKVRIIRIYAYTKYTIHHGEKKKYLKIIKKLCNKSDVIVNVCTQCALTDWLLKDLKNINIPKVLYLHSIWDFKYSKESLASIYAIFTKIFANLRWRLYYKFNTKNFKKYNLVTQLHEMDYTNKFFKNNYGIKSKIIENAADNIFFEYINKEDTDNIVISNNYIINVANYQKRKNQLKCIELFSKVANNNNYHLVLIGSKKNEYYDLLEKKKNRLESSIRNRVHLLYNIPRKEIACYVKNAKFYLMTSKWEAFPISIIESMATGVPYISSNVGIVKYLTGGVVCNNDEEYLYWINKLINDSELLKNMGKMGREEAEKYYKISEKVNEFEKELYKLVLGEKYE